MRQGAILSPLLFDLFMDDLAHELTAKGKPLPTATFVISLVNHLLYADDLVLLAVSLEDLQQQLDLVTMWADKWRLRFGIGAGKSAVMRFPRTPAGDSPLVLQGHALPWTQSYKYLGVWVTPSLSSAHHLQKARHKCRKNLFATLSWTPREKLAISHVIPLVAQYLRPKFLYGIDCFSLSNALLATVESEQGKVASFLTHPKRQASWVHHFQLGWRSWDSILIERCCGLLNRMAACPALRPCHSLVLHQATAPGTWVSQLFALLRNAQVFPAWALSLSLSSMANR